MSVISIDHVAIPIGNVESMLSFYEIFGFTIDRSLAPQLYAVQAASQKLNFHAPALWQNNRFTLRAPEAKPGCGDFCFVWQNDTDDLSQLLRKHAIEIEEGPVSRVGGKGQGMSTYVRDPDGNLVEFITYAGATPDSEETPD